MEDFSNPIRKIKKKVEEGEKRRKKHQNQEQIA